MAFAADESLSAPSSKPHNLYFLTQIFLRLSAIVTTVTAASLMLTNKQNQLVFGIAVDASYTYSPAFKFFAIANIVTLSLSVSSLVLTLIMGKKTFNPKCYFYLFLHDLIMTVLLMAGFAAGMAIGYVGKYGSSHSGWMPICDHFGKFCHKATASLLMGFLGFFVYLILTIVAANKLTQLHA